MVFRVITLSCIALALAGTAQAAPPPASFQPLIDGVIERLAVGDAVARAKWDSGKPVSDPTREASLLAQVHTQAEAAGVPAGWATRFFRDQIEASKLVQIILLDRWQRAGQAPGASVDLASNLRPRLDRLTATLIQALRTAAPLVRRPDCGAALDRAAARQASAAKLDALHRAALHEALRHVCAAPPAPRGGRHGRTLL